MSTYEISKSSLLSLKAEILRKQQELSKVKADNDVKIRNLKKNTPLDIKNKGVDERRKNDLTEEEEDLLKKSRTILEAKSKLYDKLSSKSTEEQDEVTKRYLVRFDKKRSKVPDLPPEESDLEDKYPESEDDLPPDHYDNPNNPDEEWVEYVDCLGRTRTCLRKDLDHIKANDAELKESRDRHKQDHEPKEEKKEEEPKEEGEIQDKAPQLSEDNELLSADMRRELLRQQWEKEEEALRNKDNIHYQDVLFDEARSHGVGYYAFSKDEEERATQQEALRKLRAETEAKQKKAQEMKAMREKQLAARIKAAKNRRRARLGLPPEEDEEVTPVAETKEPEEENKEDSKTAKELEKERLLEEARKSHVRPWDVGKEGMKKEHYVYSQEEWNEKKRKERNEEFAPPSSYRDNFRTNIVRDLSDDEEKTLKFTSKKHSPQKKSINPYKRRNNYEDIEQSAPVEPTPIQNELEEFEDRLLKDYQMSNNSNKPTHRRSSSSSSSDSEDDRRGKCPEFAPPPTMDYYGPSSSKKVKVTNKSANIADSIEAGLKFLRKQVEKKEGPGKRDADMFIS